MVSFNFRDPSIHITRFFFKISIKENHSLGVDDTELKVGWDSKQLERDAASLPSFVVGVARLAVGIAVVASLVAVAAAVASSAVEELVLVVEPVVE
mmetsp:Transcript_12394/g.18849  ORF Transcript_12394/g.18849 Transcript_12394/m.18849 type:complete len:96 (+) Transcript_12394:110-397(+)